MNSPVIHSHPLLNERLSGWDDTISGKWHYNDLAADPAWKRGWISFDAITVEPQSGHVYCGLNAIEGELLYRFDPTAGKFENLQTSRWSDAFDSKIHRTLLHNPKDGCFYFGTSMLHDIDQQRDAPGGKLVRYNPANDTHEVLGIVDPHVYLQSIAMDFKRGIIYSFGFPGEGLYMHDLATGHSRRLGFLGNCSILSQPHNAVVDAEGWLWGTCAETRAWDEVVGPWPLRLFKYHPDNDHFVWLDRGLPRKADTIQLGRDAEGAGTAVPDMTESRHKQDYGVCDSMCFDGKHYIYAGTVAGVLCRIDTRTDKVEKVASIMSSGRFPALGFGPDGKLYGGGGMRGQTEICRIDPYTLEIEVWGNLVDESNGEKPARIHELAVDAEGTLWFGENDNHERSSYLWSAKFDS